MDIEQLSKSQIVLLTLLVSFVTSIATGIVTVSLVDQAPPAVAQTVNRVIEKTIQEAVPQTAAAVGVTEPQKTIIIDNSDLFAKAVATVQHSVVAVYSVDTSTGAEDTFLTLGLVVDQKGDVVIDENSIREGTPLSIKRSDGTMVAVQESVRDDTSGLALLTVATSSSDTLAEWTPAQLSTVTPRLGESVVSLAGESLNRIGDGLVSSTDGTRIDTTIGADSISKGSPLITSDGTILGVSTSVSRSSSPTAFVPVSAIKALLTPAQNQVEGQAGSKETGTN